MPTAAQVLAFLEALDGENEAVLGSNNTTVNKFFNAVGQSYCGYSIQYGVKKAGSHILDGCTNPAYVPTLKAYLKKTCKIVSIYDAREGDIFAYLDQHVGFIKKHLTGALVITSEGNSKVYKTVAEAEKSIADTGAYEGIGHKKRTLNGNYTIYRPTYDGSTPAPAPTPTPKKITVTLTLEELSKGSTGALVKTIQRICYAYGFTGTDGKPIAIDGDFGADTDCAVRKAQKHLGLPVDGVVGVNTWPAMLTKLT